ncbi:ankyrin repeat-containing domain protein [Tuber borchii]|uniref:Ankyrin repeat-containing domain protein n=1 Tax=Tuber borchii TaxID=42251 RepID=A0A2T6ZNU4_TUBBO|nr:ankyrin repeat-containing domain protein [Tuber borchii]
MGNSLSSRCRDHQQHAKSNSHKTTRCTHGYSNQNTENTSNSDSSTTNVRTNKESWRIQEWLSPLEPYGRHEDVNNRRLDGIGDWVLQKDEFKAWCKSRNCSVNPTLLCYGGQGVGKTYMSSLVIDTLSEQARRKGVVVLFFYCDDRAQKDQSAVSIIGSLLRQFVLGETRIPAGIRSAFEESRQETRQECGSGLQLPDMVRLFVKTITSIERAYICIDAADELLPQDRSGFLDALGQIIREAPNTRLFLTGRPHIRREIEKHLIQGASSINVVVDQGGIARHLSRKMDDNARDADLMKDLKNDIMEGMSEKASEKSPLIALKMDDILGGMSEEALEKSPSIALGTDDALGGILEKVSEKSLPVALEINDILGEIRLARQRKMLQKVTTIGVNLDSVYGETLQQIKEQKGGWPRLGMGVLMWVSSAVRPLRIDELCHALAVEVEATDLDPQKIRSQDTVLGSCLGLAFVDKKTSTVQLIHDTLQEYLSRPGILSGAHKILGETCLAYLNYNQVKELSASNVGDLRHMPFLEYSSLYWGDHAKIELSDRAKTLALELLSQLENHVSFTFFSKGKWPVNYPNSRRRFTSLHCASYLGIDAVVAVLIEMKSCDINQEDPFSNTPLMWAVTRENHGAVKLLLTCDGVDPDKSGSSGALTPLLYATSCGDVEMVRLLTQGGANPHKAGDNGQTPLMIAARYQDMKKLALLRPRAISISDLE